MMMSRFLKDLSRGKLFRHPIHIMLVHFPSALFPTSFLFAFLGFAIEDESLALVSFYTLLVGFMGGIFAAIFGAIDYLRLPSIHHTWKKASLHALLNIIWLFVFGILIAVKWWLFPLTLIAGPIEISLFGFCVLGMFYSNYLGGELVLRHKLGTFENG
jgi:uncharacterized membrane protein